MARARRDSQTELREALKETLGRKGIIDGLKAQLRYEVYEALRDPESMQPSVCRENFFINELIREYLDWNRYKYTSSVLLAESGQPVSPVDRGSLIQELDVTLHPHSTEVPLLYSMVSFFKKGRRNS